MPTEKIKNLFSFHFYITTLFSVLILLCGLLIGWYSYTQLTESILNSGKRIFTQTSIQVENKIYHESEHVITILNILASTPLAKGIDTKEIGSILPMLKASLDATNHINTLFIAYPKNDFFLFTKTIAGQSFHHFNVPAKSRYIMTVGDSGKVSHYFYNQALQLISKKNDPNYELNTISRPWYKKAKKSSQMIITKPYIFYERQELGTTMAKFDIQNNVVIGADYILTDLSQLLNSFDSYPNSQRIIIDQQGKVIAYQDPLELLSKQGKFDRLKSISEMQHSVLQYMFSQYKNKKGNIEFSYAGQQWLGKISRLQKNNTLTLVQLVPVDELLVDAYRLRSDLALITLLIILLTLPVVWLFSKKLTSAISKLTVELQHIKEFNFTRPFKTGSVIKEINELMVVTSTMKETINHFQDLSSSLVGKQSFQELLQKIIMETNKLSHSVGSMIFLTDKSNQLNIAITEFKSLNELQNKNLNEKLKKYSLNEADTLKLIAEQKIKATTLALPKKLELLIKENIPEKEAITWQLLPLLNRAGKLLGVLAVINNTNKLNLQRTQNFIQTIACFSALALEGQILLSEQKNLLESFIQLIANAIDRKSPYTGSHCARVPELTNMLCQAACEEQDDFKEFNLNQDQWEELYIASWLHDCGKIITPEYVIDKATKLETIYDRIHELRMRFELIKEHAHSDYWKGVAEGGDKNILAGQRDQLLTTLDQEFSFVAECNIGGEYMSDEKIILLNKIAKRTWSRTLDNQLGISLQEKKQHSEPKQILPVQEPLLANKKEHLIKREQAELTDPGNNWGFNMKTPEYRFNKGELYNLAIKRGTLTAEDRFIINGHSAHSIVMLSKLPFPDHLKNVPLIAGGHHERMDGSGYPRAIAAGELPITARMLVVADIFEALTASDRPYKKRKTLSQSIKIMDFMVKDNHIDPTIFKLFLSSGVYLKYAKKYLLADQIDELDISVYL
ncbi:metal dependent phosphohydrolase [Psychromonas ingrahamii 37]|uniref:Metal dependent phosphohydrolase n=1 Tax=Psychromonas ingrahamii (strain DSM 17664 / CCUG 51855 / 37) TaxID=357804 RepID=A1SW11_PSYIN|nr:HD domain-containing phosphohydrolase [Psychromonas ingrahamii]ABM03676.1 metal dependent phosphohydrolase [Psychromonas ingrahamii 37]